MKTDMVRGPSFCERLAWWAVLAIPALVPVAIGDVPWGSAPPFSNNPFVYPKILILALLVAIAAAGLACGVFRGEFKVRAVPGGWWLAGFLALVALSTTLALSPSMAFFGGRYQLVGLMVLLLAAGAFTAAVQLLSTSRRLRELSWSTVAGGVVVAVVTILQARDIDPLGMDRTNLYILHRGPSLLGNPDFTGTYLVVPVLIAVALALSFTSSRARLVAWGCFGVTFLAVAMSLTRGAWVGVAVGVIALVVSAWHSSSAKRNLLWLFGGGGLVLALGIFARGPASFLGRFTDLTSTATAGDGRFILWNDALSVIRHYPLFGTGSDSYRLGWYAVRSAASVGLSGISNVNEDPHNVVLLLMATIGIPAALLAVSIVGATLWRARGAAFTRVAAPAQLLYAGWWAAFLGLATALLFGVSTVSAVTLLFVAGAVLVAPRAREASASLAVVRAVTGAAALVASVLLVLASLSVAADVKLASAVASGDGAGMTAAARIAPWHVQAQYQATSVAARNALVALQSGAPDGEALAQQAEQRIVALIAMNPHEYYAQSLMAFFLAQYGAIQQTAGSAQAPATLQRAKKAADAALRMYPRSPEAAYLKAFAEYHLGDNNAAIATLGPLWDVDPRFAEAGLLYVEVLDRAGRPAEALMRLKTLEQRLPGNVRVQEMARALSTSDTAK